MNKYLLRAKGYFGMPFDYIVNASSKAEALEKAKKLLEEEIEWKNGNICKPIHGGMKVIKKLRK